MLVFVVMKRAKMIPRQSIKVTNASIKKLTGIKMTDTMDGANRETLDESVEEILLDKWWRILR